MASAPTAEVRLDEEAAQAFEAGLRGRLLRPVHPDLSLIHI